MRHSTIDKSTKPIIVTLLSAFGATTGFEISQFARGLNGTPTAKEVLLYSAAGAVAAGAAAFKALKRN